MRAWTAFYFVLSCLLAAPVASATGTLDLAPRPSSEFLIDALLLAGSNLTLELVSDHTSNGAELITTAEASAVSPSSFNAGMAATILEDTNSLALSQTPAAAEGSSDLGSTLTSGLMEAEPPSTDSVSIMKSLLWLLSLAGLLAAIASVRMIEHNKHVTELVPANCKCSSCFSTKTLASRWRWHELPLWLFTARPYRCYACQGRGFAWAWQRKYGTVQPERNLVPAR